MRNFLEETIIFNWLHPSIDTSEIRICSNLHSVVLRNSFYTHVEYWSNTSTTLSVFCPYCVEECINNSNPVLSELPSWLYIPPSNRTDHGLFLVNGKLITNGKLKSAVAIMHVVVIFSRPNPFFKCLSLRYHGRPAKVKLSDRHVYGGHVIMHLITLFMVNYLICLCILSCDDVTNVCLSLLICLLN